MFLLEKIFLVQGAWDILVAGMPGSEFKVLVVAPWGYPPAWRQARYCLRNVRIGPATISDCCTGCSSSITLYLLLKSHEQVADTRLLVIGSDTVIKPGTSNLRGSVEEWFNRVKKELLETTECDGLEKNGEWVNGIRVGVVPGIGEYYGYYFKGDMVKMFLESYRNIVLSIEDFNPSIIVLDTTHGLNMLTIAVLYATVAASIVYDKKVHTVSSEPYPSGRMVKPCITLEKTERITRTEIPRLLVHDISLLQEIIDFLRALNSLRYLNEKQLNRLLGVLRREKTHSEYLELMDRIVCMIESLRSGLLGLIYVNSKLSSGESLPFTIDNIYNSLKELPKPDPNKPWITPYINNNTVEYRSTIPEELLKYTPILDFLEKYIEEYNKYPRPPYLKEFAKYIGGMLEQGGYWDRKQIVVEEASSLTEIACEASKDSGGEVVDVKLLRDYWMKAKGIESSSGESIVNPRNFTAHAALNFNIIKTIKVERKDGECEIIEVEYDHEKLLETLKEIGKNSRLHHCIKQYLR